MNRRGVALLAVLWALAAVTAVSAVALRGVEVALAGGVYRAAALRDRWRSEGCLATLRARLDRALRRGEAAAWRQPIDEEARECGVTATMPDDVAVDVNAATAEQLRGLPGFTEDLVRRVLERRRWNDRLRSFDDLLGLARPDVRESLLVRFPALQRRAAFEPVAWVMDARGVVRERWTRATGRVAVVQRVLP